MARGNLECGLAVGERAGAPVEIDGDVGAAVELGAGDAFFIGGDEEDGV